ncbi:MAG: hypothetical protein ACJ8F7_22795 [Gemmataceae bacterium]
MKNHFRLSRVVAAVALLVAAAIFVQPRILAQANLDFWNLPKLNREIEEIKEQKQELQAESNEVRRHITIKERLVLELAAGRMDLLEVASFFRNLNADHEEYMNVFRLRYAGHSDEECICLNVIDYASSTLSGRPEAKAVIKRLQSEFEQMCRRGTLQLPA